MGSDSCMVPVVWSCACLLVRICVPRDVSEKQQKKREEGKTAVLLALEEITLTAQRVYSVLIQHKSKRVYESLSVFRNVILHR